jgi:hypothetical protein
MTQKFSERSWEHREKTLGDIAETAFTSWAEQIGIKYVRWGLERPPLDVALLPSHIAQAPDFLIQERFIEVQGCGQDQTFKFKHQKLNVISSWDSIHRVDWFLYNEPQNEFLVVEHIRLESVCLGMGGAFRRDGYFDGVKPYAALSWEKLKQIMRNKNAR